MMMLKGERVVCVGSLRYLADYTKATTVNDSMISFSSSSVACKFKELFVKLASSREAHCKYAHNQIVANRTRNFNPCPAVCFAFLCLDAKNNWANLTACSARCTVLAENWLTRCKLTADCNQRR